MMNGIRFSAFFAILFTLLGDVSGQLDGLENYRLSFVLCDQLRFDVVYRMMRLDRNCNRHVAMFGDELCIEVKKIIYVERAFRTYYLQYSICIFEI